MPSPAARTSYSSPKPPRSPARAAAPAASQDDGSRRGDLPTTPDAEATAAGARHTSWNDPADVASAPLAVRLLPALLLLSSEKSPGDNSPTPAPERSWMGAKRGDRIRGLPEPLAAAVAFAAVEPLAEPVEAAVSDIAGGASCGCGPVIIMAALVRLGRGPSLGLRVELTFTAIAAASLPLAAVGVAEGTPCVPLACCGSPLSEPSSVWGRGGGAARGPARPLK